jgi:hypothetical protein
MARTGRAVLEMVRALLARVAVRHVLVLGDSHVRVFEDWRFTVAMSRTRFEVVHVAGATATGIFNRHSESGARPRFLEALAAGTWDHVVVNLGEVDAAIGLWLIAAKRGEPITTMLDRAVSRYLDFLAEIRATRNLIVLAATLQTLDDTGGSDDPVLQRRNRVGASLRQRTDLTIEFNRRVAAWCAEHDVPHLDTAPEALGPDRLVRREWTVRGRRDHHYARRPYALWMIRTLGPVLKMRSGPTVG